MYGRSSKESCACCGMPVSPSATAFKTVKECVSAAQKDLHLQTALTSTRLLAGKPQSLKVFRPRWKAFGVNDGLVYRRRAKRAPSDTESLVMRSRLQEPNVKESAGGLRDLHTAIGSPNRLWLQFLLNFDSANCQR